MRADGVSLGPEPRWQRLLAGALALASAASIAVVAHAHVDRGGDRTSAYVAAPAGAPGSGALAHEGGAQEAGAHCRICQELFQARAAVPRTSAALRVGPWRRAAHICAPPALVAQRAAAAHPARAPPSR